ncbi:MAG: hypothetical protein JNK74_11365 [Candidatus Hydrogenedentes bacterium]|nr:hypothetical protein [Candidatus Hydrogenedentota bacterium]
MVAKLTRVTLALCALIVLRILFQSFANPMDEIRADLARELAQAPAGLGSGGEGQDFAALQNRIARRASLWRELIAAPAEPQKAPEAPAGPKAPNLAERLKEVSIGRGQIGTNKIRVHTPEAPDGQWMAIGAAINGCTLESFTRDEAIFTYDWKAGGKKLSIALPRP